MRLDEISTKKVIPKVGKFYKIANTKGNGDYAGEVVYVETGPRGSGDNRQWRVSWGQGDYDVDWVDLELFSRCYRSSS